MKKGMFNIVTDAAWGSSGKGLVTTYLTWRFEPQVLSTTNMANAGHTAVWVDGQRFVAKILPSSAILSRWNGWKGTVVIGATAAFTMERLLREIDECGLEGEGRVIVHPRAGIITEEHKEREATDSGGPKHIASTMQGCGTFLADKVLRKKGLVLARDAALLVEKGLVWPEGKDQNLAIEMQDRLRTGKTVLHEGSQGFSLDISHGSHYPNCTSRGTTALQNAADMGIPPRMIGDVYLVFRPYPIRVGNVVEGGEQVGYSGDAYPEQREMTWEEVAKEAGAPAEVTAGELTTVTKRLRRVFSFSLQQLEEAARINGATKLVLNFANYLDWSCYQCDDWNDLPHKVLDFIELCEDYTGVPVVMVGTGPRNCDVCWRK